MENYNNCYTLIYTVSCDAPKDYETVIVHYLTNDSTTLEGSNVTYWCITDIQLNTFTSVCYKNASWVPDPISHCAALQSGNVNNKKGLSSRRIEKCALFKLTIILTLNVGGGPDI